MEKIIVKNFPQLQLLTWSRPDVCELTPQDAFALYERNWKHVDARMLIPRERQLIRELTTQYGHGVMLK